MTSYLNTALSYRKRNKERSVKAAGRQRQTSCLCIHRDQNKISKNKDTIFTVLKNL